MFFQQFCHLRHLILCVSSKKCLDIFPKKVPYWLKLNVNKYLALRYRVHIRFFLQACKSLGNPTVT